MIWIPPLSPFDLLQERYWPDGWKILTVCLLLNQTSRRQVEPMVDNLFSLYPTPESMVSACSDELYSVIKPLGLANKRVKTLKKFSENFLSSSWVHARELYGCGKYADDAYRIFIKGEWKDVNPQDHALNDYHNFLMK